MEKTLRIEEKKKKKNTPNCQTKYVCILKI